MRPTTVERHIIFHHHLRIILWIIIKDMHFQFSSSNNNVLSGTVCLSQLYASFTHLILHPLPPSHFAPVRLMV